MINLWRSLRFQLALRTGNTPQAEKLVLEIQHSGARLSLLERLFRNKLQAEKSLQEYKREIVALYEQIESLENQLGNLPQPPENSPSVRSTLTPEPKFVDFISKSFKLVEHDENLLQCTGIFRRVFDELDANLAKFIQEEFKRFSRQKNFPVLLQEAIADLQKVNHGQDPDYKSELSSYIYLLRYFLNQVYCIYIAWFLIYRSNLLPAEIKILDLAAGPATVAYGLGLLLESSSSFFALPQTQICYYSLEQQKMFQYRGLQLWRQSIETKSTINNTYFRFHTANIFDYHNQASKIPSKFFDFITIADFYFFDPDQQKKSQVILKEIFKTCLKDDGYVLLIIKEEKLFTISGKYQKIKNHKQESNRVSKLVEELGLNLVWYKYLTSTDSREHFAPDILEKFVQEYLPNQTHISPLVREYCQLDLDSSYTVNDYVILAKI